MGRAVRIDGKGGVGVLSVGAFEVPAPGPGYALVQVRAAGLNRADIIQRRGFYPAPPGAPANIPGLEYAGEVAAVGPGGDATLIGRRVMGIVAGGGMASTPAWSPTTTSARLS